LIVRVPQQKGVEVLCHLGEGIGAARLLGRVGSAATAKVAAAGGVALA
jgi:hypothetical protein